MYVKHFLCTHSIEHLFSTNTQTHTCVYIYIDRSITPQSIKYNSKTLGMILQCHIDGGPAGTLLRSPRATEPENYGARELLSQRATEPGSYGARELRSPRATEPESYGARELRSPRATEPESYGARELRSPRATEPESYGARELRRPRATEGPMTERPFVCLLLIST